MNDSSPLENQLERLNEIADILASVNDLRRERDSLIVDLHGRTDLDNIVGASRVTKSRIFQILDNFKGGE